MLSDLLQYWPLLMKVGGLSILIGSVFRWLTAYPLLIMERKKTKELTELNKIGQEQNRQLEEFVKQERRLRELRDLADGQRALSSPALSTTTPTSSPPEASSPSGQDSKGS